MKYMTSNNILIVLGIIVLLGTTVLFNKANTSPESAVTEETATTAEETIATTTVSSIETSSEPAQESTANSETPKTTSTETPFKVTVDAQSVQPEKVELGPRLPATTSPLAALQYAVEAMQVGDVERSLSYFRADVQDAHRTSFTTQYKDQLHPAFSLYLTGKVDPVELIEPENGLYGISIYPPESDLPFVVYLEYDGSVGEFVITEL